LQKIPEGGRPVGLEDLRGVAASGQDHGGQLAGDREQDAVCLDRRLAASPVSVERDEDPGLAEVGDASESCSLPAGEGRAAGGQPRVPPGAGCADRDGIERAFGDDRHGAAGQRTTRLMQAE